MGNLTKYIIPVDNNGKPLSNAEILEFHESLLKNHEYNPKSGFIYLMKPKGHNVYKIGRTVNLEKRLKRKNSEANNVEYEYISAFKVSDYVSIETKLHILYEDYRLTGEWFCLPNFIVNQFIAHSEI